MCVWCGIWCVLVSTYINFVFINYYLLSLLTFFVFRKWYNMQTIYFHFTLFFITIFILHITYSYIPSFFCIVILFLYIPFFFSSFPCYTYKYSSSTNLASLTYAVVWLLILVPCVLQIRQEVLVFYFCLISSVDVSIPYLTLITLLESR